VGGADRICGKRLKALLPILIESMERHGHLRLDPVVRSALLDVSAATIDRLLRPVREARGRIRRRRWGTAQQSGRACRCGPLMTGANRRRAIARPTWSSWRRCRMATASRRARATDDLSAFLDDLATSVAESPPPPPRGGERQPPNTPLPLELAEKLPDPIALLGSVVVWLPVAAKARPGLYQSSRSR
jgi:hypothetical protein